MNCRVPGDTRMRSPGPLRRTARGLLLKMVAGLAVFAGVLSAQPAIEITYGKPGLNSYIPPGPEAKAAWSLLAKPNLSLPAGAQITLDCKAQINGAPAKLAYFISSDLKETEWNAGSF